MRRIAMFVLLCGLAAVAASARPARAENEDDMIAPDGVPYAAEAARDVMRMEPLSGNLLPNGSFEAGRYWPAGWQATDGLTTFWERGGTHGQRCLRICTDVLNAQWLARQEEVRAAVRRAARQAGGDPQSLPANPLPPPPEREPTSPPYYDTVAGLHGVHYRSAYIPVTPRAIYRFSIDARTDAETRGEPKVFIKGFFDQRMRTRDGVETVRRDAYRAPMTLASCGDEWQRYARVFHPWRSKTTFDGEPIKAEVLQVQIYAYWRPGSYYFDNARLEIVGYEPEDDESPRERPAPARPPAPPPREEDEFPVFDP